jgi:hypothetical protein
VDGRLYLFFGTASSAALSLVVDELLVSLRFHARVVDSLPLIWRLTPRLPDSTL